MHANPLSAVIGSLFLIARLNLTIDHSMVFTTSDMGQIVKIHRHR